MAKYKYWLALGEHSLFTRDDNHVCYVFPAGQPGSNGTTLLSKFIEAEDIEDARKKLHAHIDERIDHELHMQKLEAPRPAPAPRKYERSTVDMDIESLSIGESTPQGKPMKEGLLDLNDLL